MVCTVSSNSKGIDGPNTYTNTLQSGMLGGSGSSYSLLRPVARRVQGQPEKATATYCSLEERLPVGTGVLANFSDPCQVF